MKPNTCTDCGRPTGKPGERDYIRCHKCQIEFNKLLYDRSDRPADLDDKIQRYATLVAQQQPIPGDR